ncbi:MAG: ferrous iron transport protein B, partial [Eggerthellaceae bacterium]|nr:ferrous iron transport protein B [Eggerthellaceae bacterium]
SDETQAIEHLVTHMEQQRTLDRAAAIADMRYAYIGDIVHKAYRMPSQSKEAVRSRMIDTFLTGKFTAIPIFIFIMSFIFLFTFNIAGPFFQDVLQIGIDALSAQISQILEYAEFHLVVQAFVVDGLINGVGSVLVFFPIIVLMFFFLSLLQDTGYMARVAFFMDRIFRKLGLSGASIVPMIMGFGCTVPAIMAARTLPSQRDRKFTILLTPFMSCATKLVIYGFVASVLFPKRAGFVIVGLYLLGIAVAVAISIVLSKTAFKGQAVPFVMELPNYRMPSLKSLFILVWEKTKGFITQAFSIIVIATIVIWFLQSFTPQLMFTQAPEESMLAYISGLLSPLFAPLGFGDWRFVTALISGFLAKETVVSTLSVLFGSTAALAGAISAPAALAFLVFSLLYTPCVAAVGAVKKELGIKWALIIVLSQTVIAWLLSWLTYMVFRLFM